MTMFDISLDLETWGKTPGCDIRSIGAVLFDKDELESNWSQFYLATENPINEFGLPKYDLFRDPSTVKWWESQSAEAKDAFSNPWDLKDALVRFNETLAIWSGRAGLETPNGGFDCFRVWCHGAAFDLPILEAAYAATGVVFPFHYRSPRDTRTWFDSYGIMDHTTWLKRQRVGEHHNALDDAMTQARAIVEATKPVVGTY